MICYYRKLYSMSNMTRFSFEEEGAESLLYIAAKNTAYKANILWTILRVNDSFQPRHSRFLDCKTGIDSPCITYYIPIQAPVQQNIKKWEF